MDIDPRILMYLFFFCAVILAIWHNRKQQKNIMDYYEKSPENGSEIAETSLKNQERMIILLEDISKKLDK